MMSTINDSMQSMCEDFIQAEQGSVSLIITHTPLYRPTAVFAGRLVALGY